MRGTFLTGIAAALAGVHGLQDPMTDPVIESRLPAVGTTIFTVMSGLAQEHGAVNLGQGFPDFDCDPVLVEHVAAAMREGLNQYAPMPGVPALREVIAAKLQAQHGRVYDPGSEITVTAGATQAILTAVLCSVHPGDEVMVLEPAYDSYEPSVELAGGRIVRVPLTPRTFRPDFERIAAGLSPRTRVLILNSPHNPSASVWTGEEMRRLEELLAPTRTLVIADEVYEQMVFDGAQHESVARFPGLAARSFLVSSFGKTCHVTGWKVGYVAAPARLTAEFRKVHQFNVFAVNTPMQHALARYLADPRPYLELPDFYQRKRDLFRRGLRSTRFEVLHTAGSYFQCVGYRAIRDDLDEDAFCRWLTAEVGVAAIPLSAFYADRFDQRVIRFCFAKRDETLSLALERLSRL